ncbi:intermembrane lipid transfer protein VPS13D-like [Bolinopsis microptera]|uniref:intermembrane lipid transfer protein VPS13D-like n=1 Tax=Bolinopsis microptera TaxID=2820187 RepID=UPI00307A1432
MLQSRDLSLQAESSDWTPDKEPVTEAAPNSIMPFSWPRNDLDQLLSICIPDVVDCEWSGGFCINNPQSSVVSMRGTGGRKIFLQCTVVLQRSSYHVVFSDFNDLPTPYRIENHSLVSVEYRQSESRSDMSTLQPGSWCPYHWDEPVLKPHELDLKVTGGEPMKVMITPTPYTHLSALVYENAVYLTLSDTWKGGAPAMRDIPLNQLSSSGFRAIRVDEKLASSSSRLVLDVPQGVQVLVKQYNPHSLSQLWQVKESGQLMHFKTKLFLDIPGRAPNPGTYASLIVKPPDENRHQTQCWRFRDNGYLTCKLPGLAVSPRNGLLHDGSDAVLDMVSKNPPHIYFHKRRPGCGAVLMTTSLDGPTVVIKLLDIFSRKTYNK